MYVCRMYFCVSVDLAEGKVWTFPRVHWETLAARFRGVHHQWVLLLLEVLGLSWKLYRKNLLLPDSCSCVRFEPGGCTELKQV